MTAITVGVIGATGNAGQTVVNGLLSSPVAFTVTSFTRESSVNSQENQRLKAKGVCIVGYDLSGPRQKLVDQLKNINVLISCITWEHLDLQLPWIEAAKEAGVKRFVPSEWVGPCPRGVHWIKDHKLEILGAIQRARLPYTIIDAGCWYSVFVPKDGNQKFALTDIEDVGKYVAQIVADPRTINKHVFAYTEVLSMNEIWDTMARVTGEKPEKEYVSVAEIHEIIEACRERLEKSPHKMTHPDNIMDCANYNMGEYRISWCVRGDNTPEHAEYLGYLDFWKLFPSFQKGTSLESFFQSVVNGEIGSTTYDPDQ
ncbi:isoflavone reductase family protein [Aspergillus pseudotamarii]|uniref:Isoflavone reductase family protein n=1 Tax=Aspergillus pseudotamarii TaxID=132259 RepID=A0A5N6STH2_ASPPS|nr:isoflavone reductase family protein [Aspergillus pseudotamarii]KAE8136424.1 isoflavone reductase family protein [Aspergillus pseudotamarii]